MGETGQRCYLEATWQELLTGRVGQVTETAELDHRSEESRPQRKAQAMNNRKTALVALMSALALAGAVAIAVTGVMSGGQSGTGSTMAAPDALPLQPAGTPVASQAPANDPGEGEAVPVAGPATKDPAPDGMARMWEMEKLGDALEASGLFTDFPGVWAGTYVEEADRIRVIQYDQTADPEELAAFLAVFQDLQTQDLGKWGVTAKAVNFNEDTLAQRAFQMVADSAVWTERLGISDILGSGTDIDTGQVIIYTSDQDASRVDTSWGVPIRIESSDPDGWGWHVALT